MKNAKGKGIITSTNTNFATVAAIIKSGSQPFLLDMDERTFAPTLGMVKDALALNPGLAGLVWVHIGGVISPDFPDVVEYCHSKNVWVVEDAAHAHGSSIDGRYAGNLADGAAFSFFPTKVVTTGEGGMITTNSKVECDFARSLRNQGKRGGDYGGLHEDFGSSWRMTEINALLGQIQLRRLAGFLHARRRAYEVITAALKGAKISYVSNKHMASASNYKLIVLLQNMDDAEITVARREIAKDGISLGGNVYDVPIHRQPVFKHLFPNVCLPNAEYWCRHHICPPITSGMSIKDAQQVGISLSHHVHAEM